MEREDWEMELILSALPHTWLIDVDGTIVVHNGYLGDGGDALLERSAEFLRGIPEGDAVILLTSRDESYREATEGFLRENGIRYDAILFGLPVGERILINDDKPSGLCMSHAVRVKRDEGVDLNYYLDEGI